jgi:hypothetical protein
LRFILEYESVVRNTITVIDSSELEGIQNLHAYAMSDLSMVRVTVNMKAY